MGTKKDVCCLMGNMERNYEKYNAVQFAADPFFLRWQLGAEEDAKAFWTNFRAEHLEKEEEVREAIRIIRSVRINDYRFSDEDLSKEWIRIRHSAKKLSIRRKNRNWLLSLSAAASVLLIIATYFFVSQEKQQHYTTDSDQLPVREERNIVLTLSNDSLVTLNQDADISLDQTGNIVINGIDNKKLFNHKNKNRLQNNKLIVPWGKQSSLTLSDGSKVWINSGTTLEFPSVFSTGLREIKVSGEIYIEVIKDPARPFIVNTDRFSVSVLGTRFNVSAYNEDKVQAVVLAEGSVKINTVSGNTIDLKPEERFSMNGSQIKKDHVAVYDYISWKDGIFRFSGEPLQHILTKLSRYYNTELVCSADIRDLRLRGKLALFDDLKPVLDNIAVLIPVKYEVRNNQIIISKNEK